MMLNFLSLDIPLDDTKKKLLHNIATTNSDTHTHTNCTNKRHAVNAKSNAFKYRRF